MPVSVNLNNGLDKAYEDKTLDEILSAHRRRSPA